jgi:hypothetical protein
MMEKPSGGADGSAYIYSMDLPVHHESIMSEHTTIPRVGHFWKSGLMRNFWDFGDLRADKQPVIGVGIAKT